MDYLEFRRNLEINHMFTVRQERSDPDAVGDFWIDLLFSDNLPIEITCDRGTIEIEIAHSRLFGRVMVPLIFAVCWAQERKMNRAETFDSIESAQEYLFGNIDSLALIVNVDLMRKIARDWAAQRPAAIAR